MTSEAWCMSCRAHGGEVEPLTPRTCSTQRTLQRAGQRQHTVKQRLCRGTHPRRQAEQQRASLRASWSSAPRDPSKEVPLPPSVPGGLARASRSSMPQGAAVSSSAKPTLALKSSKLAPSWQLAVVDEAQGELGASGSRDLAAALPNRELHAPILAGLHRHRLQDTRACVG